MSGSYQCWVSGVRLHLEVMLMMFLVVILLVILLLVMLVMVTPDPMLLRGSVAVPDIWSPDYVGPVVSTPSQLAGTQTPASPAPPPPLVILISVSQSVGVVTVRLYHRSTTHTSQPHNHTQTYRD